MSRQRAVQGGWESNVGQANNRLRVEQHDGIGILLPAGHLTRGDGDQDLSDQVESLLRRGRRKLVLDMAGVDYVDAAGLGLLVRCHRRVVSVGGRLVVTGVRSKVRQMLRLADLGQTLDHVEGLDRAVAVLTESDEPLSDSRPSRVA